MKHTSGFTLLELLVVLSVLAIITIVGLVSLINFRREQTLRSAGRDLRTYLRLAQNKALVQEVPLNCTNLSSYQLAFTSTTVYEIRPVCGQTVGSSVSRFTLPPKVTKTAGGDIVAFTVLSGSVSQATSFTLTFTEIGFVRNETVTVTAGGAIQ